MLRVAVPNKGSLSEAAAELLAEAGYAQRRERHELALVDTDNDVEFFFLRPRDIATYVGTGRIDVGLTGRDLLLDGDAARDATEVLALGFARSTFRYAALPGTASSVADFAGKRIATSYPGLVRTHLAEHGIEAEVIRLDGAVETAVRLGVADIVADVVETGRTLRAAGLEILGDEILRSEAVLIRRGDAEPDAQVDQLVRRINGVIMARRYVMIDYDIRVERVEAACAVTPGIESPTVSPLHDQGWVAVRAMVERPRTNAIMDELWELGARGILVTDILACRV
jgi:ATP phosphoribosyltransferase